MVSSAMATKDRLDLQGLVVVPIKRIKLYSFPIHNIITEPLLH